MPLILLDLDDTLIEPDGIPRLKPEAGHVLRALSEMGHTMVLFSHNSEGARLAKACGIYDYFAYVSADCWEQFSKETNLQHVRRRFPDVGVGDMVLFDDTRCMVEWFREKGGSGVTVDHVTGVRVEHLLRMGLLSWHPVFGYALNPFD